MSESSKDQKQAAVVSLLSEVSEGIASSNETVIGRVRDMLVEKEVATRVDTLDKAIQKRRQLAKELAKVNRPDNVQYDSDGNEVSGTYSKDRLQARKKAREALEKLEKAIEAAMTSGDGSAWGKLRDLA